MWTSLGLNQGPPDYESIYNFRYRIDHRICIVLCDHNNNGSKREIQERRRT